MESRYLCRNGLFVGGLIPDFLSFFLIFFERDATLGRTEFVTDNVKVVVMLQRINNASISKSTSE
ncbi:MAG: hypothetical protein QXU98_07120 [Candidatus Parvarchaeota archaeon]